MIKVKYDEVEARNAPKDVVNFKFKVTAKRGTPECDALFDLLLRKTELFVGPNAPGA